MSPPPSHSQDLRDSDVPHVWWILKQQKKLKVQAVGAGSINQAVKSLAVARSYLVLSGNDLNCIPTFSEVTIDGNIKTAICFIVTIK